MHLVSWNLQARRSGWVGRFSDRVSLLDALDAKHGPWEIFCAQEVPRNGIDDLVAATRAADAHHAWHEHSGKDQATATAAAVLIREPWQITAITTPDLPSPKRAVCTLLTNTETGMEIAVSSAALPPAGIAEGEEPPVDRDVWGDAKAEQARALAGWARHQHEAAYPVLLGIDANAPREDPPSWTAVKYWWRDEALLLGPEAVAKDAYRIWLDAHPELRDSIRALRPHGPLACTHLRGNQVPSRYDHLLINERFTVQRIEYVTHDAFAAGSDHALLDAEVQVRSERQ